MVDFANRLRLHSFAGTRFNDKAGPERIIDVSHVPVGVELLYLRL